MMARAFAALARGEATLPQRQIVWLPEKSGALGLMPAHLNELGALGLKAVTFFPRNEGTELDSHQGAVLLFEAGRGRLLAIIDATSITAIRTAAVSGLATRLLAREDAGDLALVGSGVEARTHLEAMLLVRKIRRVRVASKTRASAHAPSRERESRRRGIPIDACATVAGGRRGRRHRLHRHVVARAGAPRRVALARRPRQRRRLERRDRPRARHGRRRALAALRRPPRVGARRGGGLPDRRRRRAPSATRTSSASSASVLIGARPGPHVARRDHALQVASASPSRTSPPPSTSTRRRAASGHRQVRRVRRRPPRSRLSPIRRSTRSARRAARIAGSAHPHAARAAGRRRPGRDLPQARVPPADRLLQAARRRQRDGASRPARRSRRGVYTALGGQHGAGRGVERAPPRHPLHGRRSGPRAAGEARRDRAPRRPDRQGPLRPLVAGPRGPRVSRASRASSSIPSPTAPSSRATARSASRSSRTCPTRTRSSSRSAAAASPAASPPRLRRCGPRRRSSPARSRRPRRSPPRSRRGGAVDDRLHAELRGRHRRAGACCPRCGRSPAALLAGSLVIVARRRSPRRCGSWPSARTSSPRAPAPRRSRRPCPARPPAGKIVCVVSGGNIDAEKLARILRGEVP